MLAAQHGVRGSLKGAAKLGCFNMMRHLGFAAGALALALAAAGPASAAKVIYTYKGTVSEVFAYRGNPFQGVKTGDAFTAVYTRDEPTFTNYYDQPEFYYSGVEGAYSNAPVSSELTVGTYSFLMKTRGEQFQTKYPNGSFEQYNHRTTQEYSYTDQYNLFTYQYNTMNHRAHSESSNYLLSYDYRSLDDLNSIDNPEFIWTGAFGLDERQFDGEAGKYNYYNVGILLFDTTSLTVTTAVPEPAAWALMIGGFGMAGAMLRRRRALAA